VATSEEAKQQQTWMWIGMAAGVALGGLVVAYLLHQRKPTHRLDRLLRRCEERIGNIESSLVELESTLSPS